MLCFPLATEYRVNNVTCNEIEALVCSPCQITQTFPGWRAALRCVARAASLQSQRSIATINRRLGGGDLSLQTNSKPLPKPCHISHSTAKTKVTQPLVIYMFQNSRGCGRPICLQALTLSEWTRGRVNSAEEIPTHVVCLSQIRFGNYSLHVIFIMNCHFQQSEILDVVLEHSSPHCI